MPASADPEKREAFKKLQDEILSNEDIEVLFYDEAFFRRESTVARGWYLKGQKSQILCPVAFEKVGVCGAVSPRFGELFSLMFDGFGYLYLFSILVAL